MGCATSNTSEPLQYKSTRTSEIDDLIGKKIPKVF